MRKKPKYGIVTVDTENPQSAVLSGRCQLDTLDITLDGHPAGVSGIMDVCETCGARATFFVDVYESVRFPSVRAVVETIISRGHDVQLHTHPAWMFDRRRVHMRQYSLGEQEEILGRGIELFAKWTGGMPVAHRAGAFGANSDTMRALKTSGIPVDSSVHPDRPNCHLSTPVNQISEHNGIVEVPVIGFDSQVHYRAAALTFYRRRRFRPLNLDGCSNAELQWFLTATEGSGIPILHLTLHSYSFIKWDSDFRSPRWNPMDYEKMGAFLGASVSQFGVQWITLGEFWRMYSEDKSRFDSGATVPCRVENRPFWNGCVRPIFGKVLRFSASGCHQQER
jgi:peptidoglycan/xylan/chitin deacetylase (PgdA/CDA1 family)